MTPAFYGRDGRSLATRVALLSALAASAAGTATTLIHITHATGAKPLGDVPASLDFRIVERRTSASELSIILDQSLTDELLEGRFVVLDLPGDALDEPGLAGRLDVVRIVPVGPCGIDVTLTGASGIVEAADGSGWRAPVRLLSCGLATGVPGDEEGRLGNAGRGPARVGGAWLDFGLPALPGRAWDDLFQGSPDSGLLALGHALLREIGGPAPTLGYHRQPEILAARLWGLAMDVQAYEGGFAPTAADLARAPIIRDWRPVLRGVPALAGRFAGHPYIGDGERSITSEIFHTDGLTYARTLSRLYRLGRRAVAGQPN